MNFLGPVLLFSYFNLNTAFEDEFIFNSDEIIDNITVIERRVSIIFNPHVPHIPKSSTDHMAIQIIIFAACIILIILIGLLLCSICCKNYRRDRGLLTRSPSLNSIQELIRERLLDRPPSYHESQGNLNAYQNDNPPAYNTLNSNTSTDFQESEPVTNSPVRVPTSPPVYTISSKMSTTYANNGLNLPCTECESDTDSPPSYHVSEGVVNPVLVHVVNNSTTENSESHSARESQHLSFHNEFYI